MLISTGWNLPVPLFPILLTFQEPTSKHLSQCRPHPSDATDHSNLQRSSYKILKFSKLKAAVSKIDIKWRTITSSWQTFIIRGTSVRSTANSKTESVAFLFMYGLCRSQYSAQHYDMATSGLVCSTTNVEQIALLSSPSLLILELRTAKHVEHVNNIQHLNKFG